MLPTICRDRQIVNIKYRIHMEKSGKTNGQYRDKKSQRKREGERDLNITGQ